MRNGVPLAEITEEHCGVWIEGSSVRNPIEFSIAIVDLAISNGLELDTELWEADRPHFLDGEYDFAMLEDLSNITDISLEHLNSQLPANFYFDFEDGLCLFKVEEESE